MTITTARRFTAEFLGTAFLVAAVVGSGIMAERLSGGNTGLALLANTIATAAALAALIFTFGPISGAHFNPAVSACDVLQRGLSVRDGFVYVSAQITGGVTGVAVANLMFELPPIVLATKVRTGPAQWLGEFVATFGLLSVIWGCSRLQRTYVPPITVAAYIAAAYWFTSSTSFANPAVTISRSLTDTFTGIRPTDVPMFLAAQFAGAVAATYLFRWLVPIEREILMKHE